MALTQYQLQMIQADIRAKNAQKSGAFSGTPAPSNTNLTPIQQKVQDDLRKKGLLQDAPTDDRPNSSQKPPIDTGNKALNFIVNNPVSRGLDRAGQAIGNFGIGAAKSVGNLALGAAELGSRGLEAGYNHTIGALTDAKAFDGADMAHQANEDYMTPEGTAQKVGFTAGVIGSAFLPQAAGMRAAGAASALGEAPAAARALAGFATEAAPQLLLNSAREGKVSKEAVVSSALQGAGAIGGKLVNIPLAIGQGAQGVSDIANGDLVGGATNLGFGALGLKQSVKNPGLFVNHEVLPPSPQKMLNKGIDTYNKVLGTNKSAAKRLQSLEMSGRTAKSPGQILAEHDIPLESDGNNTFNTTESRKIVREKMNGWDSLLSKALQNDMPRISLNEMRTDAIKSIKSSSGMSSLARQEAIQQVEKAFSAEIDTHGELVTDRTANDIKRGLYADSYNRGVPVSGQEGLRRASESLKRKIENVNDDVDVKKINQILGELSQADLVLKEKHGAVVQGGMLGKKLNAMVGTIIGSHFGPLGAAAGHEGGKIIADYEIDPYRKTMAAQRGINLSKFIRPQDQVRSSIESQMQSREQVQNGRKLLPAPATPLGAPAQTPTRQPTQAEIVQNLRQQGYKGPLTKFDMDLQRNMSVKALPPAGGGPGAPVRLPPIGYTGYSVDDNGYLSPPPGGPISKPLKSLKGVKPRKK